MSVEDFDASCAKRIDKPTYFIFYELKTLTFAIMIVTKLVVLKDVRFKTLGTNILKLQYV